jgi:hypothetical protein
MATKGTDVMRKKDFFAWFGVVSAVVYGCYLLSSYASTTLQNYIPRDEYAAGILSNTQRLDRIEKKVDVILERTK